MRYLERSTEVPHSPTVFATMLPNFVVEKLFITSYLLVIWPVGGLQLPPRTTLSGRAGCRQKADLLRSSIAESPRLMRHESKDNDEQFNWHKQVSGDLL